MFWRDKFELGNQTDYEIKYPGKYGAKGEKREKKERPTKEQIWKQNQKNRETKIKRVILLNFNESDHWCTLKYPSGTRFQDTKEVTKDMTRFLRSLKGKYSRRGYELKYIYRIEVGKQGGIHIHILVNRIPDSDIMIQESWKQGRVYFGALDDGEGVEKLAAYIVKREEEADKQLRLFEEDDQKRLTRYSCSRNLKQPQRERKFYKTRTVRKIVENGPQPRTGYYIIKDSVVIGVNLYTGMSFIRYSEKKIEKKGRNKGRIP